MTFGARNGKFCQRTNCQDSKLASKFFPSCNYVVANFWISDNFGREAFLGLDIRCTLLERFALKGDEISRCHQNVSYSWGPFTLWKFHNERIFYVWCCQIFEKDFNKIQFSCCTKIINIATWLFLCADIWTFEGQKHLSMDVKNQKGLSTEGWNRCINLYENNPST